MRSQPAWLYFCAIDLSLFMVQDVMLHVRRKSYKKRALNSLLWTIGQNLDIAVNLYALIQKATASKSVTLDLKTNEVVHAEGAFICNDTGARPAS